MYSTAQKDLLIKGISVELAPNIDAIFETAFFAQLKTGGIGLDGVRRFATEYYVASNGFPKLLALACARMPTDDLRMPFVSNLWDEHGQGTQSKSHRALLGKFLTQLGVSVQDNTKGPADRYLNAMGDLTQRANIPELLGMFGPGCEAFTPKQYRILVKHFRERFAIPEGALEFFTDHIKHDHGHMDSLRKAMHLAIKTPDDVGEIIRGARESIAVERQFWDDMSDHCK